MVGAGEGEQDMKKISSSSGTRVINSSPPFEFVMATPEVGLVTVRVVGVPSLSTGTSKLPAELEPLSPKGLMLQEAEGQDDASTEIRANSARGEIFLTATSSYIVPLDVEPDNLKVTVVPAAT